jgi:hypothetical protein
MPPARRRRISAEAASHRGRLGGLTRTGVPADDPRYDEERRALRAAVLADHIERTLDDWPPLTLEQRSRLAELLRPVRIDQAAARLREEAAALKAAAEEKAEQAALLEAAAAEEATG